MNYLVSYSDSSHSDEDDQNTELTLSSEASKSIAKKRAINNEIEINSESITQPPLKKTKPKQRKSELPPELKCLQDAEPVHKRKRLCGDHRSSLKSCANCKNTQEGSVKDQLNLPNAIQSMFNDNQEVRQWKDDPTQHGNRIRSFPHVEGNWATHVFIPVKKDERLVHFVNQLLKLFEPLSFEILPEFHISLSRTVTVRHHWIDPLVESLKEGLSSMQSCVADIDAIKIYSNDEKTRSFLCIEVAKEDTAFIEYVSAVDECFDGFKLPRYYEDPSFHISVAWCLGNVCEFVTKDKLNKAKKLLETFCVANPELSVVFAQNICCRSGNKSFLIPLIS